MLEHPLSEVYRTHTPDCVTLSTAYNNFVTSQIYNGKTVFVQSIHNDFLIFLVTRTCIRKFSNFV